MKPACMPPHKRRFPLDELLSWWDRGRRPLPWRRERSAWRTWVSEVMLQQTRVETVIPYFQRFMLLFPAPARLADAADDTVMKAWEGLGYYQRIRNLQRAATLVVESYGGEVPGNPAEFALLPGAGPYITAAVMSISFKHPLPAVDGNVLRVIARYRGSRADTRQTAQRDRVRRILARVIPPERPGDFNEALMELGALVCTPRKPDCGHCPLAAACRARRLGLTTQLPVRSRRTAPRQIDVAVAVVTHLGKILVRRRSDGHLNGLWEFPGGRLLAGETRKDAILRKCREELNVDLRIKEKIALVRHAYSHFRIQMEVYRAIPETPLPPTGENLRWVTPAELESLPLPGANRKALPAILEGLEKREEEKRS
ncbi:MAG: A/G-specific adenine glycosylase [Acidobacteriota bacterium]|jgi:A/G-specific adenine glycosylase|nr:A/G-specific adenine glycosylase [Acidobacteriota bacterium]